MKWIYDGYTKVKIGSGRGARMSEDWIYKCSVCGHEIRVNYAYRNDLPTKCDKCGGKVDDTE